MESYRTMSGAGTEGYVQRQSDLALIPPTTENPDWVKYLDDVSKGAEVLPFDYAAEDARQKAAKDALDLEAATKAKEAELTDIDIRSIRSIRATLAGTNTAEDTAQLQALEAEATATREKELSVYVAAIEPDPGLEAFKR